MKSVELFRLLRSDFAATPFDGEGARLHGGRWNNKGNPCVYLGGSRAICVVETLVHLQVVQKLPLFSMFQITVPESEILRLDEPYWPDDWANDPAPLSTKLIGDNWLAAGDSLVLYVPSSVVIGEWNALLNPNHPSAKNVIATARGVDFSLDPRLVK
ncbi:TPA: RES family NAD+ phosphorylase [Aeromonas veronii]